MPEDDFIPQLQNWVFDHRWILLASLLGLLFLGYGIFSLSDQILGESKVEIIRDPPSLKASEGRGD